MIKRCFINDRLPALMFYLSVSVFMNNSFAAIDDTTPGDAIMDEVYKRHQQFPYIYEEQSMIMEDRNGLRDTRKARRYSRMEEDGSVKFLLLFDYPKEVKGVALLASRSAAGETKKFIYLPAFGEQLIESSGTGSDDNFLGTDFSVENLTGEVLEEHQYVRRDDKFIDGVAYHVLDVYKADDELMDELLRRHYISQDTLFITLTHHYDKQGRISKIQSQHNMQAVDGNMWRANMILMQDKKEQHQSLIKISRRVFSHDYVPVEVFTAEWLYKNYPYIEPVDDHAGLDAEITEEVVE